MDIDAKRRWLRQNTGSEAELRLQFSRALDEIERLRALVKRASELAGTGFKDEACEILHAEVFPDDG